MLPELLGSSKFLRAFSLAALSVESWSPRLLLRVGVVFSAGVCAGGYEFKGPWKDLTTQALVESDNPVDFSSKMGRDRTTACVPLFEFFAAGGAEELPSFLSFFVFSLLESNSLVLGPESLLSLSKPSSFLPDSPG